jgi:hypothetical protein
MSGRFHSRVPTAYLQDAWRFTDRLSVNAGLRWSAQILSGASGGTAQRFPDEWQPRLGFSWQLGRHANHRVLGSYGRFYQQIPLNLSTLWYVDYIAVYSSYSTDPRQPGAVAYDTIDATGYEEDWAQSIDGIEVENFDEFTLGYERLIGDATTFTVRGIRRNLRSSFQWGYDPSLSQPWVLGTPGKGAFAILAPPKRQYTALEVALEGAWKGVNYRASYVLSRTWGNYTGLYSSDHDAANPGGNSGYFGAWQARNSTGRLPNDRPHVVKLTLACRPASAFAIGAFFSAMSGIPRNNFGGGGAFGPAPPVFLWPRGSAGRTPMLWDVNLRLAYDLPWRRAARSRLVLDLLHLGNPREVVQVEEQHFFSGDAQGNQSNRNPNWLRPTGFQPPMMARLGVEASF